MTDPRSPSEFQIHCGVADALTAERARELFSYDPQTGVLSWRSDRPSGNGAVRIHKGREAGCVSRGRHTSYRLVRVDGRMYPAHRLIFLIVTGSWPRGHVDHRDRDGLNNIWDNLRDASRRENAINSKIRADNRSGFKGVGWSSRRWQWRARIYVNKRRIDLGWFCTPEEASAAYHTAAIEHFGDFARIE
jgi:hypothetical protein